MSSWWVGGLGLVFGLGSGSLLRVAMGCAQARLVRTRASGRCQGWTGMGGIGHRRH